MPNQIAERQNCVTINRRFKPSDPGCNNRQGIDFCVVRVFKNVSRQRSLDEHSRGRLREQPRSDAVVAEPQSFLHPWHFSRDKNLPLL